MIGKVIEYQAKQITYNVYCYFKERKKNKLTYEYKNDINIIDIVSEVTGLSKSTVTRIIRDGNLMKATDGTVVFKQQEKKKHVRKKRINVDACTDALIRRKVIQFYTVKNEVPSVRKLNALIKKENILKCSDEYLRQLLHKLGFTNAESDSSGMLRERSDIVTERLNYLKAIRDFRDKGKDIYFLNETELWETAKEKIPKEMPSFVILHASGGTGFGDGSCIMIKAKQKTKASLSDQHIENYNWIKKTVLPNVPPSSVIVLNIPYCATPEAALQDNKPTTASTRTSIESWLRRHNIPFNETDPKSELCQLANNHMAKIKYSIRKLFIEKAYEVLHLPQNHLDLNPAAVMWNEVKEGAGKAQPLKLFMNFTKNKWLEIFETVKQTEDEYYCHDTKVDDADHIKQLKKEVEDEEEIEIKSEIETDDGDDMDCE